MKNNSPALKVFVSGATGVLGRRVLPKLIAAGHSVVALSRSEKNSALITQLGAEPRRGDLFNAGDVERLSAGCEVILHLATSIPAKARTTARDWEINDRIRREGTSNLVAAALTHRCKLYVQQSITFLYGNRKGEWVDEDAPIARRLPSMLRSAVDMERLVADAIDGKNLPGVILRLGSLYCHDSFQTASMFSLIRQGQFSIIGKGDVYWNMLDADDAAAAIVRTADNADKGTRGVFNICDDEPVLYRDLVHYTAELLQAKRPGKIPAVAARTAIGADLVDALLSSVRCKNDKARRGFGWEPMYRTYREGLREELKKWLAQSSQNS